MRMAACLMAGILMCGSIPVSVLASEVPEEETESAAAAEETADADDAETVDTQETASDSVETPEEAVYDTEEAAQEDEVTSADGEQEVYVLLPGAGFSYAFAAKKVSLRDVEDNMYSEGVITAKRTTSENSLTLTVSAAEASETDSGEETGTEEAAEESAEEAYDEEDRAIEETTLTPVQKKEQSVVDAVSETQNITVDHSIATILSATAVSVVSDTETAVALQEMLDKKQTQAKLDQGVISAVEAEALMAVYEADMVVDGSGTSGGASQDSTASESSSSEDGAAAEDASGDAADESSGEASDETDEASDEETTDQLTAVATDADGNEIVVAQVNDYINIRADASSEAEIVGYLYDGSVATVLGRTGNGWVRIESGGIYGYIREEYVATGATAAALAEEVATQQAVVTTQTLRVRAAAQADSDVISLIGEGETLDILEVVDGWYKVNTEDGEGYISADFADVEQVYPTAVAVEEVEEEEEEETSSTASGTTGSSSTSSSSSSSYSSLNTYTGSSSSGTASGQAVANYALQFVGNPYVWGGTSLTNGADCSGFTMAVYANFGVSLPHSSYSQEYCGTAVASLAEAQPGDLLIYDGHVAIYLGNNQIVHASNPANGICVGTATYRTIIAIRRIFN